MLHLFEKVIFFLARLAFLCPLGILLVGGIADDFGSSHAVFVCRAASLSRYCLRWLLSICEKEWVDGWLVVCHCTLGAGAFRVSLSVVSGQVAVKG